MTEKTHIEQLLEWQPLATNIESGDCDICGGHLLSYTLGEAKPYSVAGRVGLRVECGYWCVHCGFSNAGTRPWNQAAVSVSYERLLIVLHQICHDVGFWEDVSVFERLMEYGWVKPKEDGKRPDINGSHSAHWYVLTAKGHLMLAPRENRAEGLPVPFFPVSHRRYTLSPDGAQWCENAKAVEQMKAEAQA